MGHFQVAVCLGFEASLGAQLLKGKWVWFAMGQWNTINATKRQNVTTKTVKNLEANQLAIYKCALEVQPGTSKNKFNEWLEQDLNSGTPA